MADKISIHPGVEIQEGAQLGEGVEIGIPPAGVGPGELPTVIGPQAHIRSKTVIYAGNVIGARFQTGHHVLIRERNTIGDDVSVGSGCVVEHHVTIGDRVRIDSQAFIPEYSILEEGCWIGPNVVLTNDHYPDSAKSKQLLKGPGIRRGACIGANATILPGVEIGQNALVGEGAVVTRDVPPSRIAVGCPARVVGAVEDRVYPEDSETTAVPTAAPGRKKTVAKRHGPDRRRR